MQRGGDRREEIARSEHKYRKSIFDPPCKQQEIYRGIFSQGLKRRKMPLTGRSQSPSFDLDSACPGVPERKKMPGAVARPSLQHYCRGYLFVPESRYIVKILFPSFLRSSRAQPLHRARYE